MRLQQSNPKEKFLRSLAGLGVTSEKVTNAMRRVRREHYVPEALAAYSYRDGPLPIGEAQTISQPSLVALMTQALCLEPDLKVLEIGTGTGYQTALLAELSGLVYSVERIPSLLEAASERLKVYPNVILQLGDGALGWADHAPFDRIIVTAGARSVPPALVAQLGENGKMVIPVGEGQAQLCVLEKRHGEIARYQLFPVNFVPLVSATEGGFHAPI